ncbi:uncharacterized protein LOC115117676 [Oncorhynchus nerka]|uniref:uncharacterized protein LOC115117676 n=1 Tax=Oncorhynchus nerka TaxID=8023 RepID=UPI0031B867BC
MKMGDSILELRKMWTSNNGIVPKKKTRKVKEVVIFPLISNGSTSLRRHQDSKNKRATIPTFQRLQEMFFSDCRSDHAILAKKIRSNKRADRSIPLTKVSEESESQITAHLRYQFLQRHVKSYGQSTPSEEKGVNVLHLQNTYLFKDKAAFKALTDGGLEDTEDTAPQNLLQSLVALEEEEEDRVCVNQDVTTWAESVPEIVKCLLAGSSNGVVKTTGGDPHSLGLTVITDDLERAKKRRFMIYICGGYKDTVAERSALMETVFPRLYLYCKQRGYDFRMVDLRLGVGDPVSDRHDTAELHVEALAQCQETLGPNFILFLGQKYEVQTLPSTISREVFEAIVNVVERDRQKMSKKKHPKMDDVISDSKSNIATGSDTGSFVVPEHNNNHDSGDPAPKSGLMSDEISVSRNSLSDADETRISPAATRCWADFDRDLILLQTWYRLDENCDPPVYRLLPVSTQQPDFLSRDGQRRRQARKAWQATCLHLWGVLQRSGTEALGEEGTSHLLRTVLDWEVEQGLQSLGAEAPPEAHCHCYKRVIPDLHYSLRNEHAAHYIDLLEGRPQVNHTLNAAHQGFMDRVHKKLRHTNIYERNVDWGRNGLNPKHNRSQQFYTEHISSHFQRTVINSLNKVMKGNKAKGSFDIRRRETSRMRIQEEIHRHVNHGHTLENHHVLRDGFLGEMRRAVEEGSSVRPILLLGPPGWGKSTTMARLAHLAPSWITGAVKVLVCFVGLTGESRNVRLVLQNLCVQLAEIYSHHTELSEGLPHLVNEFHSLLGQVRGDSPVILVLDGIDALSEEHGADLSWLSTPLPLHVHLILSATTDSACAHTLQKSAQPTVLSLPPLSPDDITKALKHKLQTDHRRLQDWQWQFLLQACLSCPSPLYLEVVYAESVLWSSFSPQGSLGLPPDLEGLYVGLLACLERTHGEQLVGRAAAVISLSRGGVTEEELLDLLGRDGKVLQEVSLSHSSSTSSSSLPRVPCVLWARLRRDLGGHLTEAETDGTWVYRWTHSELGRVCVKRYLKTDDSRMLLHANYADYFRGTDSPHRNIFQPLAWKLEEDLTKSYVFNLRKLHGLPYHLVRSGQILAFLSECVFNYEFLLHKAWALSVLHLQEDLKGVVLPEKELVDMEVLAATLELSRTVLLQDPCQLASQVMGRLGQIVAEDVPVAPGDPQKFSYLHALLAQCARSSLPVLVPSYSFLVPPGEIPHTLLAGHTSIVTALTRGQRGLVAATCDGDGTLKVWDLELGRAVRTLEGVGGVVGDSLTLCLEDRVLVVGMGQSLQVREVDSGKVIYSESDSLDVPVVTTTCEGQLLVAFYDGSHLVKVFDLVSSCSLLCCVNITLECDPIHKDHSVLVSHNSIKDYVLFAYRSGGQAAVLSARGGAVLSVLRAQHGAASIQGVEMTNQYLLLFCRYPYKRDSEIIHIELYSTASFKYERSILGCSQDDISQVTVNRTGTHAVAFCPSPRTGITQVVTWNLETEDHKHIACFPGILTAGVCLELRFCVGVCSGERYPRLWDLASRVNDQTLTYNVHKVKRDGTEEVILMGKRPRYAVCKSLRPGTVRVWNLARSRFTGRPVRVEHGLYGNTDVALAHDLKLYILTDRGTATFTDTPSPIFQTLLVYDLIKRSYVRRQSGLYIVPCPRHEYRLLEGQLLLGLSETRNHLILWDLESGYIKGRMKASHTESLLSSSTVRDRQSQIPPNETTALVMPWDRRTESHSAKCRRLEKEDQREKEEQRSLDREKYNSIDQYLLSGDQQVVVCSYFSHHLNVFSVGSQDHLHTLEDRTSLLILHTAALTHPGGHLVLANYSQAHHIPYLTLWDLQKGTVRKRLKNEPGVCCVAITDDASRVAFGISGCNKLKVWDPFRRNHKTISGYASLRLGGSNQLYITEGGAKAILLAGELSLWDLEACNVLSVLSPDAHVQCLTLLGGDNSSTLLLGLSHSPALVAVRLTSQSQGVAVATGSRDEDVFSESSSSEDEDDSRTHVGLE